MADKPTYKELEQRVKKLEQEVIRHKSIKEELKQSEDKLNRMFNFSDYSRTSERW